ncbi:hypothetical protein PP175_10980 [Aneurinibacillus sp. Ricciae_BoGa-3]|uniref:HipA family kinase n=1 Tax=Aneurinibacillus sp. Ricciae_BoGa-3 TaxID=3022697 RepID=UPI002341873B|nr:HipA family kinase [Aneurinibacillus sp. Ricciae_BoGa-3]WCK56388.1 hypothetical protein PP175_10980 [Aneurinibacillus sp. Ricciae_BoGa-3]
MKQKRWKLVKAWKSKRQGQVWIVKNKEGTRGYFKFTTRKQWYFSGPMIANEWIAASLANRLGFPVAQLTTASVRGPDGVIRRGVVSVEVPAQEVITWREADEKVHCAPEQYLNHIEKLCTLVVFDAWIANIDRALGKNLILYRDHPDEKYNWYLIDHGHALYGSPRKWKRGAWNSLLWQQLWRFYHVPNGLLRIQSSFSALEPMIRKIESLRSSEIDAALKNVPRGYLRHKESLFIKRLLLHRQKRIRKIIINWLAFKGTKEYGNEVRM